MTLEQIEEIKDKVAFLKRNDTDFKVFGSSYHRYDFNELIKDFEVQEFEEIYEIKLPVDYKEYISKLGNGGPGPNYGILPLHPLPDGRMYNTFEFLGFDFSHKRKWEMHSDIKEIFEKCFNHPNKEVIRYFSRLEDIAYISEMAGAIYISDCGCNWRQYLVVTGDERGNIWCDQRVDGDGIFPLIDSNGNHLSFIDWYFRWLDKSIEKVKK